MSVDRLSNMLSALKNAVMVGKTFVELPHTKECEAAAKVLEKGGFLAGVKVFKEKELAYKMLHLEIVYEAGKAKFSDISRVSRPGKRVYKSAKEMRPVFSGFGICIVSTSRGVMSNTEARKKHLGGEVLCEVL